MAKAHEEPGKHRYLIDFTSFLEANSGYLTLSDNTAGYIDNTMWQMSDGRSTYVDRPLHYPFNTATDAKGTMYKFTGSVEKGKHPYVTLAIESRKLRPTTVATLDMFFQQVGEVVQSASTYTNRTDELPIEQQVHNSFGILLPYAQALCQRVADAEHKPVVHAVRLPPEKAHWSNMLESVQYEFQRGGLAYVRTYEPTQAGLENPMKAVAFVMR